MQYFIQNKNEIWIIIKLGIWGTLGPERKSMKVSVRSRSIPSSNKERKKERKDFIIKFHKHIGNGQLSQYKI